MPEAVTTEPIVREVHVEAEPETVFEYFVDPRKLTRWLAEYATVDPRPGGAYQQSHRGDDGKLYVMRGEFVELVPGERLVFTWGNDDPSIGVPLGSSTVEVTFERREGGTLVRLVHRDLREPARGNHDKGWAQLLPRLADAVAEGKR
jgi:uncharacterized protein YndB with AHSA1/START domain